MFTTRDGRLRRRLAAELRRRGAGSTWPPAKIVRRAADGRLPHRPHGRLAERPAAAGLRLDREHGRTSTSWAASARSATGTRLRTFESGDTPAREQLLRATGSKIFHAQHRPGLHAGRLPRARRRSRSAACTTRSRPAAGCEIVDNTTFAIERRWDMGKELAEAGYSGMSSAGAGRWRSTPDEQDGASCRCRSCTGSWSSPSTRVDPTGGRRLHQRLAARARHRRREAGHPAAGQRPRRPRRPARTTCSTRRTTASRSTSAAPGSAWPARCRTTPRSSPGGPGGRRSWPARRGSSPGRTVREALLGHDQPRGRQLLGLDERQRPGHGDLLHEAQGRSPRCRSGGTRSGSATALVDAAGARAPGPPAARPSQPDLSDPPRHAAQLRPQPTGWRPRSPRSRRTPERTPAKSPSRSAGDRQGYREGSGVGALAVVGLLLLATAALASGLAHGVLLIDRIGPGAQRSGCLELATHGRDPGPGSRSASTTTRVTSPEPTTLPSAGVPGGDGEAVQPPVDVRRRTRSPRPRRRPGWRPGARAGSGCRRWSRPRRARLDRGAGGRLAPGQQPRRAEHRQAARSRPRAAVSSSVTVKRQRRVIASSRPEGDQVDAGHRRPVPLGARPKPSRS